MILNDGALESVYLRSWARDILYTLCETKRISDPAPKYMQTLSIGLRNVIVVLADLVKINTLIK